MLSRPYFLSLTLASRVKDMTAMFRGASSFNQSLPFDTTSVEYMAIMFDGAHSFSPQELSFDTRLVQEMGYLFRDAHSFNADLSGFSTASVTSMRGTLLLMAQDVDQPRSAYT